MKAEVKEIGKDMYEFSIGLTHIGVFNRSDLRYLIHQIDDAIGGGLK